jgi:hypothetical protein
VYFDGVTCFGHSNGAIQVELAANVLMPEQAGVRIDVLQAAHLRCTPAAAAALRDVLDKALAMIERGKGQAAATVPVLKN